MRQTSTLIVFVAVLAAGMIACEAERAEVTPETSETALTDTAIDTPERTAETWVEDPTLGTELNETGRIALGAADDDFVAGDTIYYAMELDDAPANASVRVAWYGPEDTPLHEETQQVRAGEDYIHFEAPSTSEWVAGEYRVELYTDGVLAHEEEFEIEERES